MPNAFWPQFSCRISIIGKLQNDLLILALKPMTRNRDARTIPKIGIAYTVYRTNNMWPGKSESQTGNPWPGSFQLQTIELARPTQKRTNFTRRIMISNQPKSVLEILTILLLTFRHINENRYVFYIFYCTKRVSRDWI